VIEGGLLHVCDALVADPPCVVDHRIKAAAHSKAVPHQVLAAIAGVDRRVEGMRLDAVAAQGRNRFTRDGWVRSAPVRARTDIVQQDRRTALADGARVSPSKASAPAGDQHRAPCEIRLVHDGILHGADDR